MKNQPFFAPPVRDNPAIEFARNCLQFGYAIIPVAPGSKTPLNKSGCSEPIRHWKDFYYFVERYPDLNYGIVTGAVNKLFVLDVDSIDGMQALKIIDKRNGGGLFPTVNVVTAKGMHFYYSTGDADLRNKIGWLDGVDCRSNGGYVIGPGSRHQNGHIYRFGQSFKQVGLAQLPVWIKEQLTNPKSPVAAVPTAPMILEGQRNRHLTSVAGKLRNEGLGEDAILAALSAENKRSCQPSLDETEVERIAASISRYEAHAATGDEAQTVAEAVLAQRFRGGAHLLYALDGNFWHFEGTHWKILSKAQLHKEILKILDGIPTRRRTSTASILSQSELLMQARCAGDGDPLRFATDPPVAINCLNCELWPDAHGQFVPRPHSHLSYFRHRLEVDYDPDAACPLYDGVLREIFAPCENSEQMMEFWNRLMGYTMQPHRPRPVIVIGKGEGSNGKTSLLQLLVRLLGHERVSAMPIGDIDKSRFAAGSLDGKLLLLDDDVKAGTRLPDGQLKKLSEAKIITGEHKFKAPFSFTVRAIPIMLCNNAPSIADLSYGLRRRLLVVPFNRTFSDAEADVHVFSKITALEMPGVLNRFLEGLTGVIKNNWELRKPLAVAIATENFLNNANPLSTFLSTECQQSGSILVSTLFKNYGFWCQESGVNFRQQRTQFKKNLENLGYNIKHGNKGDLVVGLSCASGQSVQYDGG